MGKGGRRHNGRILDANTVVNFVFFFQPAQNGYGIFHRGFTHKNGLKSTLQSSILFNIFPIFVKCSGPHTSERAPGQGGLEHIGCVHRTFSGSGTHHCVKLINEKDNFSFGGFDFF